MTVTSIPIENLAKYKDLHDLAVAVNSGLYDDENTDIQEKLDHYNNTISCREIDHIERKLREFFTSDYSKELAQAGNNEPKRAKILKAIEAKVQEKMTLLYSLANNSSSLASVFKRGVSCICNKIASIKF